MDEFLKTLEEHCPGDDAHDGYGESRPLLERCGECALLYQAHEKAVASKMDAMAQARVVDIKEIEALARKLETALRERDDYVGRFSGMVELEIKLRNEIQSLTADLEKARHPLVAREGDTIQDFARVIEERDSLKLQIDEMQKRIYEIGLTCDRVTGLEHGFCPDIGEPRDNLTRIKIALERFTEKRKDEEECPACYGQGRVPTSDVGIQTCPLCDGKKKV